MKIKSSIFSISISLIFTTTLFGQNFLYRENKGQLPSHIIASLSDSKANAFLCIDGISYSFSNNKSIDIKWSNSKKSTEIRFENPSNSYFNYMKKGNKIENVRDYQKVMLKEVYSNIDLLFYSNGSSMEYDFLVHPNADLSQIEIEIQADSSSLDNHGNLVIYSDQNKLIHKAPSVFQENNLLKSRWFQKENGVFTFIVDEPYDTNKSLIIDPIALESFENFIYNNESIINNSVVDSLNNIYLVGTTVLDNTGTTDIFVKKMNTDNQVLFTVFLGGFYKDEGHGIDLDSEGNIFITGFISSIYNDENAYIAKLSPTGELLWEESFGQENITNISDKALRCKLDKYNNLYISGTTHTDGLATPGAHQTIRKGVYIAKYNSQLELEWRTYTWHSNFANFTCDSEGHTYVIGNEGLKKFSPTGRKIWQVNQINQTTANDYLSPLSVSPNDLFLCVGGTISYTGTATQGVHQTQNNGGRDAIITVIDSSGTIIWASHFGGEGEDQFKACEINDDKEVIVSGVTFSSSGIATEGSYLTEFPSNYQRVLFFAKFSGQGNRIFGTYYPAFSTNSCHFTNHEKYYVTAVLNLGYSSKLTFHESGLSIDDQNDFKYNYIFNQNDLYYFHSNLIHDEFELINQEGKVLLRQEILDHISLIKTENLPGGVYFLKVNSKNLSFKILID